VIATAKLAQEHLDFLWPSLQQRKDVIDAKAICAKLDDKDLAVLLRHHRDGAVSGLTEIEQRQTFDYALQAYSLLTVALVAGYVPADLGKEPRREIESFLGREPLRRYYEENYPVLLPSLLRLHAKGEAQLPQESGDLAWGSFQWFVRFSSRFEKDPNLERFLNLLDGFYYGDLSIETFLNGLREPATALVGILKPPDLLTPKDQAILGMFRFMTFCKELDPALKAMADVPLTQSACWFYYAYWFKGFAEDVGSRIESCLSILQQWINSSTTMGADAAAQGEKAVAETRTAITALVDGHYAAPLVNRLREATGEVTATPPVKQMRVKRASAKVQIDPRVSRPKATPELHRIISNFRRTCLNRF
jgi:hypothetical protein